MACSVMLAPQQAHAAESAPQHPFGNSNQLHATAVGATSAETPVTNLHSPLLAATAAPQRSASAQHGLETKQRFAAPATQTQQRVDIPEIQLAEIEPPAPVDDHGFDVAATIAAATAELGQSMPTGWDMPGECIAGAKRWIRAGGGAWVGSGTPVANYVGARKVALEDMTPGDIVQYTSRARPDSWEFGVHTLLITDVHDDGTYSIIEQNNPGGTGLVTSNDSWQPDPPEGFDAVAWRF